MRMPVRVTRTRLAVIMLSLQGLGVPAHAGNCAVELNEEVTFTGTLPEAGLLLNSTLGDVEIIADPTATTYKATARKRAGADTDARAREILARMNPQVEPSKGASAPLTLDSGFNKDGSFKQENGTISMSIDWVITVPASAAISIVSSLGDVDVKGMVSGVNVDASLGDVSVEAGGRITINASLGDVEVRVIGSPAAMEVNSSMGDVEITTPPAGWGTIQAATSKGEVSAENWSGKARRWVSNDSSLEAEFDGGGPAMMLNSSMGDVTLRFVN